MSGPSATIGVEQLAARMLGASTSIAALPTWAPSPAATERTGPLYVALRIDTLIYLIDLTLYPAIPLGWQDFIQALLFRLCIFRPKYFVNSERKKIKMERQIVENKIVE
jgi:hypothetical protein